MKLGKLLFRLWQDIAGGLWGRSWKPLGARAVSGMPFWTLEGHSWGGLGPSCGQFVAMSSHLGNLWCHLATKMQTKSTRIQEKCISCVDVAQKWRTDVLQQCSENERIFGRKVQKNTEGAEKRCRCACARVFSKTGDLL